MGKTGKAWMGLISMVLATALLAAPMANQAMAGCGTDSGAFTSPLTGKTYRFRSTLSDKVLLEEMVKEDTGRATRQTWKIIKSIVIIPRNILKIWEETLQKAAQTDTPFIRSQ